MRRTLIVSGTILAIASLAWGIAFGGIFAVLAAMGTYTAMQTIDLICEQERR